MNGNIKVDKTIYAPLEFFLNKETQTLVETDVTPVMLNPGPTCPKCGSLNNFPLMNMVGSIRKCLEDRCGASFYPPK